MTKNRVNLRMIANLICVLCLIAVLVLQMQPYWQYEKDGETETVSIAGYVWLPKEHKDLETVFKDALEADYEEAAAQLTEAEKAELMAAATKGMTQKEIKKLSKVEEEELLVEEMGYAYNLNKNVTAPAIQLASTLPVLVLWVLPFLFELVSYPFRAAKAKKTKEKVTVWDEFRYDTLLAPVCTFICGVVGVWGYLTNVVLKMGADCQRNLCVSIALVVIAVISVLVALKRRDD